MHCARVGCMCTLVSWCWTFVCMTTYRHELIECGSCCRLPARRSTAGVSLGSGAQRRGLHPQGPQALPSAQGTGDGGDPRRCAAVQVLRPLPAVMLQAALTRLHNTCRAILLFTRNWWLLQAGSAQCAGSRL